MKTLDTIRTLFVFTCLSCLCPARISAQLLTNTSWRPIDNMAIVLKNNGIDTLKMTFLPNNRLEFRYHMGSSVSTSHGLWWQQAPGYFKFLDTSGSGLSLLCGANDTAYVQYSIDTNVMYFANMQDSCGARGAIFTDSKWALLDNNVGIQEGKPMPDFRIYPLPAAGSFNIEIHGPAEGTYDISIYNMSGSPIYNTSYTEDKSSILHIPHLPEGIYLVRITSGNGIFLTTRIQVIN